MSNIFCGAMSLCGNDRKIGWRCNDLVDDVMAKNRSKVRSAKHSASKRYPLARQLLLPLSLEKARSLSLELHLTLVALRNGCAHHDFVIRLFNAVGVARFLHEAKHGRETSEHSLFDAAWKVLLVVGRQIREGCSPVMSGADILFVERVIILYDKQISVASVHDLVIAHRRLEHFLMQMQKKMTG